MSDFGDDEQEGTFSIFFAEGEVLAKQEQYKKAIESFTKVLRSGSSVLASHVIKNSVIENRTIERTYCR